jgi:hypothetical protein
MQNLWLLGQVCVISRYHDFRIQHLPLLWCGVVRARKRAGMLYLYIERSHGQIDGNKLWVSSCTTWFLLLIYAFSSSDFINLPSKTKPNGEVPKFNYVMPRILGKKRSWGVELKPSIYLYLHISVQQTNEVTVSYFFYSLFIPPSVGGEPNEVTDYRCEEE